MQISAVIDFIIALLCIVINGKPHENRVHFQLLCIE